MSALLTALLLLGCPLMMMLMMRGMQGHRAHQPAPPEQDTARHEDPQITARIAELEQELANVRSEHDRGRSRRSEPPR